MCICNQIVTFDLIVKSVVSIFILQFILIIYFFIPIWVKSLLRVNEVWVVGNDFWKGSEVSVEIVCVVLFICWKCFMDDVHVIISSNIGFFPFVAARQLMEFLYLMFDESDILWEVGQI